MKGVFRALRRGYRRVRGGGCNTSMNIFPSEIAGSLASQTIESAVAATSYPVERSRKTDKPSYFMDEVEVAMKATRPDEQ